jgi:hypothetical protein
VPFVALLDANVLYPICLCDVLLSIAETEVFQVRWSERILEEAERNVKRNRLDAAAAAISRRFQDMRRSFAEAMVTGYETLECVMTNHPKDRHKSIVLPFGYKNSPLDDTLSVLLKLSC